MEEEEDKKKCPCGKAIESRNHIVAECELHQEERDVLEGEMRDLNKSSMESLDALDSREKTIATLGYRWWPQTAKQDGDKICRRLLCSVWKKLNEYLAVGGVSVKSRREPENVAFSTSVSVRCEKNVDFFFFYRPQEHPFLKVKSHIFVPG